jgi:hypothetical protein
MMWHVPSGSHVIAQSHTQTQRELLLAIAWGSFPTIDLVRDTFAVVTLIFAVTFASSILYVTVKCQVLRHPLHHVHEAFAPGLCSLPLRPAPSLVRLTLARTHEHSRILPRTAIEDKENAEEQVHAQSLPPPSQRRSVSSGPRVIREDKVRNLAEILRTLPRPDRAHVSL